MPRATVKKKAIKTAAAKKATKPSSPRTAKSVDSTKPAPAAKRGGQSSKSLYSLHPGFAMEESSMAKLEERTGLTLQEWIARVKREGPPTEKERRAWLKDKHGITTNYCWWIAERAEGKGAAADYDPEADVKGMFAGAKAAPRPIYNRLLALGLSIGPDVKACPCQTIVPLYRNHVFAQIKPTTNTRIDLGFALKDTKVPARLIDTGGFAKKDRITHRIPITTLDEIDGEVEKWLRKAYEMDAGK